MIFEKESLVFNILDVLELHQSDFSVYNKGRNFDALSFRYDSETVIKTGETVLAVSGCSICYFPAHLDYERISKRDNLIVVHFNSHDYLGTEIEYFVPKNPERYKELFAQLYNSWVKSEAGYRHRCYSLLYEIFELIYKETYTAKRANSRIDAAVKYLSENYAAPDVTVEKAAKLSNFSEVYFRKLFKNEIGVSPKKYIIEARIKRAVALIESGYYSLSEVARLCGFTDYKYFSTEFRRVMGVPPSKYEYDFKLVL